MPRFRIIFIVGIAICFLFARDEQGVFPKNEIKHLAFQEITPNFSSSEEVFDFTNPDTTIIHTMNLLRNENGFPIMYYSDIQTPVCIDDLCKPVYIEMYWNLLGRYIGYGIFPEQPLTKYDHEVFVTDDYTKLHHLLQDPYSILDRKNLSSLYDLDLSRKDTITFKGVKVDGVTGATKKEIKNSVVDGALYSCYTLWHIAHGQAKIKILHRISEIKNDRLLSTFLNVKERDYNLYALQEIPADSMILFLPEVTNLVINGDPLTRSYILKKMPPGLFRENIFIEKVYENLSLMDINTRTLLIDELAVAGDSAVHKVSSQLVTLTKNQIKTFMKLLEEKDVLRSPLLLKNLIQYVLDPDAAYGYIVDDFLKNL